MNEIAFVLQELTKNCTCLRRNNIRNSARALHFLLPVLYERYTKTFRPTRVQFFTKISQTLLFSM